MAICIYKTDVNWHSYLRSINATEVYFWRSRLDKLGVSENDWFYFMSREENVIVGRGRFRSLDDTTVGDAWHSYRHKCGAPDFVEYQKLIKEALKLEDVTDKIQCIVLNNVQWLPENNRIPVSEELFNNIDARNPFRTDSIPDSLASILNDRFINIIKRVKSP